MTDVDVNMGAGVLNPITGAPPNRKTDAGRRRRSVVFCSPRAYALNPKRNSPCVNEHSGTLSLSSGPEERRCTPMYIKYLLGNLGSNNGRRGRGNKREEELAWKLSQV